MNQNILIIGGDIRQLEVAKLLTAEGMNVSLVGFDQSTDPSTDEIMSNLQEIDFQQIESILVPVSGIDEEGKIKAPFSKEEMVLTKDQLAQTPKHCVIYTGIKTPYLNQLSTTTGRKLVPMFERDDIAILNSIPTAEGTLQIAMEQTDFMIHGSNVMVLGYGLLGKRWHGCLQALARK